MDIKKLEEKLNRLYKENKLSIDTYVELMEFADPNQALQLQQGGVSGSYNDLDKLKSVFDELGVKYKEQSSIEQFGEEKHTVNYDGEATYDTYLELENGVGYYGFTCDFYFLEGKFQNHGVWE